MNCGTNFPANSFEAHTLCNWSC
ncbi:MAG: hypothetical protein GW763_13030 [Paraglaciecola sp.]|nr:hypothetical protein [Paraglaciecola sp.]NCT48882.1 hypothetical protein [Paraglaciecola sp.]